MSSGGTIEVIKNGPRLDLRGTWHDFRWPLIGKMVPFHSSSGEFTLGGTWPYSVHASGMAQARDLPPMQTTILGALARDRFTFTKGDVDGTVSYDATALATAGWSTSDLGVTYSHAATYGTATLHTATNTVTFALDNGAADGFNLMPPVLPQMLDAFTSEVIPLLQRRGRFRTEYQGDTLRAHLGLSRPARV